MSIDRENTFSDADSLPPASDYHDSSEGLGGIPLEEDDGDEQEWASALGTDKVGRQFSAGREFANVSQASRVNVLYGSSILILFALACQDTLSRWHR
jgi:hypothetical protein